jgi:arginine decarboxylase
MTPKKVFFTKGVGRHKEKLASFELALRDAGIEKFNLVTVSSIMPPNCKMVTKEKGLSEMGAGEIVHCVLARNETNENNRLIVSSIGVAVPTDSSAYGYLSEHHSFGETDEKAGEYAEDLAASMLATTLGIEFDSDKDWNEREQEYKASGKIIRTRNITQSAEGRSGIWTTVTASAVFIEQENGKEDKQVHSPPAPQIVQSIPQPVQQAQPALQDTQNNTSVPLSATQ